MRKKVRPAKKTIYEQSTALQAISRPRVGNNEPLLTVAHVARRLQVSRGLVYVLMRSGELPSLLIRRVRRIRARDLDQFMRESWIGRAGENVDSTEPKEQDPVQGRLAKWKSEHGHE